MSLVPLDKRLYRTNATQSLFVAPGKDLYVLERGTPGRTIDPEDVDATETIVDVYDNPEGTGSPLTQPLTAGASGGFPYWVAHGSYDLYAPQDTTTPIQPWEAGTGLDYTPEDVANKATVLGESNTLYPSQAAVKSAIDGLEGSIGDTTIIAQAELTADADALDTTIECSTTEPSGFVIIEPYASTAEVRKISSVAGSTVTLTTALAEDHVSGARVTFFKGPLNLRDLRTSSSDWGAIINDAVTAGVRHFFFPQGEYPVVTTIAASPAGIRLEGEGGMVDHYGNVQGVKRMPAALIYSGTGTGSAIDCTSSIGFTARHLGIYYSSGSFTGRLIDWRGDMALARLDYCDIGSLDHEFDSALANVHMNVAWNNSITNCNLHGAQWNILGDDIGQNFCDTLRIDNCNFHKASIAHIGAIGRQWTINNNFFGMGAEPSGNPYDTPAVIDTPSTLSTNLDSYFTFSNNSIWDGVADSGPWFKSSADNAWSATFHGNHVFKAEGGLFELLGGGQIVIRDNPYLGSFTDDSAMMDLGDTTDGAVAKNVTIQGSRWGSSGVETVINRAGHRELNIESYSDESYSHGLRTIGGSERLAWPADVADPRPTLTLEAALGTGATGGIAGTDLAGFITLNPGSGATGGKQATITLGTPHIAYPSGVLVGLHVTLTPVSGLGWAHGSSDGDAAVTSGVSAELVSGETEEWAIRTKNAVTTTQTYAYRVLGI